MTYPLEGIKVLDMSRVLAGPFAGRMLADLGADVVKLEPPEGDISRLWGARINRKAGFFNQQNVGKRGICVDLSKPDGVALFKKLVGEVDILIENFRSGVMRRLGIDWSVLREINPKLIMCSISGFGQNGPESERAAYAPVIHAELGLLSLQAKINDQPMTDIVLPLADTNSSLHGVIGILSALYMRERTNEGQHLDIAMTDAMLFTHSDAHYSLDDAEDVRMLPAEVWPTPGGHLMLAGDFRYIWKSLVRRGVVTDPATPTMPVPEKASLRRTVVADYLMSFASQAELIAELDDMKIVWGVVRNSLDINGSPTVRHRESIIYVEDEEGTRPVVQSPYRFSVAESGVRGAAPHLGVHNLEVLSEWLQLSSSQIASLEADGVLVRST